MGEPLNRAGDLLPPGELYEACRVFAKWIVYRGELEWDFSAALAAEPDLEFVRLVRSYLRSVLEDRAEAARRRAVRPAEGWKLPETTLVYPWITRMFPDAYYIIWSRDPRDAILSGHLTDDLAYFGIPCEQNDDLHRRRAISWYYQWALVKATPRPARAIDVRFEDFVLKQGETLDRLEAFLGVRLARIVVREDSIGRWRTAPAHRDFDFLAGAMRELGYA